VLGAPGLLQVATHFHLNVSRTTSLQGGGTVPACRGASDHRHLPANACLLYNMKDDSRTSRRFFFRHRVVDNSHLPRKLSEIRTYANGASASLNPDLACSSCPTTDTRVMISDTTKTPWDSIGLLARQDANSISKCAF